MNRKLLTIAAMLCLAAGSVLADSDPAEGEKVFKKCKACHTVGEDAKNKVGPILNAIVGANAGANPDFKYSDALLAKAAEGLVWDADSLTAFLTKPKDFIPGTKMTFAGLRKDEEIEDIISYLATFE